MEDFEEEEEEEEEEDDDEEEEDGDESPRTSSLSNNVKRPLHTGIVAKRALGGSVSLTGSPKALVEPSAAILGKAEHGVTMVEAPKDMQDLVKVP